MQIVISLYWIRKWSLHLRSLSAELQCWGNNWLQLNLLLRSLCEWNRELWHCPLQHILLRSYTAKLGILKISFLRSSKIFYSAPFQAVQQTSDRGTSLMYFKLSHIPFNTNTLPPLDIARPQCNAGLCDVLRHIHWKRYLVVLAQSLGHSHFHWWIPDGWIWGVRFYHRW
jgi:hypothetical protein